MRLSYYKNAGEMVIRNWKMNKQGQKENGSAKRSFSADTEKVRSLTMSLQTPDF
jgi:hypothetical protein